MGSDDEAVQQNVTDIRSQRGATEPGRSMGPPAYLQHPQSLYSYTQARRDSAGDFPGNSFQRFNYDSQRNEPQVLQFPDHVLASDRHYASVMPNSIREHQIQQSAPQQGFSFPQESIISQAQPQSMYSTFPHYSSRNPDAPNMLADPFAIQQYSPHNNQGDVAMRDYAISQAEQPEYETVQSNRLQKQPSLDRVDELATASTQRGLPQQEEDQDDASITEGLRRYEEELKLVFDAIIAGKILDASERLLLLSRWLLSSVVDLKLHLDDETKHAQRLLMWKEFNHCWEALGQKQKTILQEARLANREPVNALSADHIVQAIDELVALCDRVEQYGLVDYQMGIWEEQIVDVFTDCLQLLPEPVTRSNQDGSIVRDEGRV